MKKRTFLVITIILSLMIGCSCGHNADLLSSETVFLPNLDMPATVKQVKTDNQIEYLVNDERYIELEESSPDTDFTEYYGWQVDLSCFELYAETNNGDRLYRSPNDGNVDFLVLERDQNGEKIVKLIAREKSIIHDWAHFADDFFDVALVNRIITKSERIKPILNAHFHGTRADFTLSQNTNDYLADNCFSDISLEVKDIPGLWYTFCVIGDETVSVFSRTDESFVDIEKTLSCQYGIVLPEMPGNLSTMLSDVKEMKNENKESGYWFNDKQINNEKLAYEKSLLIPLKEYLSLLPIAAEWENDDIGWVYKNGEDPNDLSRVTCYMIDLNHQSMQEKETGFSFQLNDGSKTLFLQKKDGRWMIDMQSFVSILDCLRYNYYCQIDTEGNRFQLFLQTGQYDYRTWDLRSFEKGTFGGTNKWPSGILY